jgi:hypothetical protein
MDIFLPRACGKLSSFVERLPHASGKLSSLDGSLLYLLGEL